MTRLRYGSRHPATLSALLAEVGPAFSVSEPDRTLGADAFRARVLQVAGGLRAAAGIRPGDRVALWLPNGIDYLAAIFACARLGALAIHINTRFRAAEVGSLLRRSEAIAVATRWDFAPVDFPSILAGLPPEDRAALRLVFAAGSDRPATIAGLPVLPLDGEAGDAGADEAAPDRGCLTFTTSGTTSGPKLVLHDQRTIAGHAHDVARRIGLDRPGAGYLAVVPLCGTFGNAAAMAAVAGGARIVCMPVFDGETAAELIRSHRLTHLVGGDDMLERIAAAAQGRPFEGVVMSGFAAFRSTAPEAIAAAEAVGLAPRGLYGSSEVQALFSFSEGGNRLLGGGVPSSPAAVLAVRDPETGVDLASGVSGELWIGAPSRFLEYLGDPAATAKAIAPDGMFRTGDLARLDGEGFVYEARLGDTMRLGGFLVSAEEIEAFLQGEPGVAGVQVVAAAPPGGEAVPVAFVLPSAPGLDAEALLRRCREGLARFKVPSRIVLVDAFPVVESPNGPKVQKVRLRERAQTLLAEVEGVAV